jgi:hypothetical protein
MDPTYSLPDNVALLTLQVPASLYHCCHNVPTSEDIYNFYVMFTMDVRIGSLNFSFLVVYSVHRYAVLVGLIDDKQ